MITTKKASDWFELVIRLAVNNKKYITSYQVCDILHKASENLETITGKPLFEERGEEGFNKYWVYESIKNMNHGILLLPNYSYGFFDISIDADLIQVNAIRKELSLPVIHSDLE